MRTLIALAVVAGSATLFAQSDPNHDMAQAKAMVHVIAPIKVKATQGINFGTLVVNDPTQPASVVMDAESLPNLPSIAFLKKFSNCARMHKKGNHPTAATVHVSFDCQEGRTANKNLKITLDKTVALAGGIGPDCVLTPIPDRPLDPCCLPVIKGQVEVKNYVRFAHFGVGGKLDIPVGALGVKKGIVHVKVEYM